MVTSRSPKLCPSEGLLGSQARRSEPSCHCSYRGWPIDTMGPSMQCSTWRQTKGQPRACHAVLPRDTGGAAPVGSHPALHAVASSLCRLHHWAQMKGQPCSGCWISVSRVWASWSGLAPLQLAEDPQKAKDTHCRACQLSTSDSPPETAGRAGPAWDKGRRQPARVTVPKGCLT